MSDAAGTVIRVNYEEGQVLAAADLLDEQAYLISMRQRLAVGNHRWGIVRGLNPSIVNGALQVSFGVAVDGFGRYLIVADTTTTDISTLQGDSILIWLIYALDPVGNAPAGQNTRWLETTLLRLEPGTMTSPRQTELTATDWPVLLGVLARPDPTSPYKVNLAARRPCIGLVGETITAASGASQLQLGPDFAVRLPADQGAPGFSDKFRINAAGNLVTTANSRFDSSLVIQPDASLTPSGLVGVGFSGSLDPPKSASPWTIYRTGIPQKGGAPVNQLNFEVAAQENNTPGGNTAAIGRAADGKFQSCLTVSPSGDVTVTGVLRVQGLFYEGPIAADPTDPRFLLVLSNAASGNLGDLGPGPLAVAVGGEAEAKVGAVTYRLGFTNNGTSSIGVSLVTEVLTLNDQLIPSPTDAISSFTLTPGQMKTINRVVSVKQAGKLAIGVWGIGAALDGSPLSAKDAMFIQVDN